MFTALCALSPGEKARIHHIQNACPLGRRLLDLGFVPGARVACLYQSPGGYLQAYLAQGAVIALRRAQAAHIITQREEST